MINTTKNMNEKAWNTVTDDIYLRNRYRRKVIENLYCELNNDIFDIHFTKLN